MFIDNDYNAGSYAVTIIAEENNVTFSISVSDDNIHEESETFILIIDRSSLPNGVLRSYPYRTAVTIMDSYSK